MSVMSTKTDDILAFIKAYHKQEGYSPSYKEIGAKFRIASPSVIHYHLNKLQQQGKISKGPYSTRSIFPETETQYIHVPLLGEISAGKPIRAVSQQELFTIPASSIKAKDSKNLFALRVKGSSMVDDNIHDNDVVIVRQNITPKNGERVVALIDNDYVTLKRFYQEPGRVRLQPSNNKYEPIYVLPSQSLSIQGTVASVIKAPHKKLKQLNKKTAVAHTPSNIEKNKIIVGDAVQEMTKLPDASCDVVLIDPPYNIGKDFGNNSDNRELADYIAWCKEWLFQAERVLKPHGTMFIYGFSEILAHISVELTLPKRWLVWHYTNKNVASLHFWQRSHESIIVAYKNKPLFNRDAVREPYTEGFLKGAAGKVRKNTKGRFSKGGGEPTTYNAHASGALPRDVIKIPALAGGAGMSERWFICRTCNSTVFTPQVFTQHREHDYLKHPTQKPIELTKRLLLSAMPKDGGLVLVPFVGSGSECYVAKQLGFDFIGYELNPEYAVLAEGFIAGTATSK